MEYFYCSYLFSYLPSNLLFKFFHPSNFNQCKSFKGYCWAFLSPKKQTGGARWLSESGGKGKAKLNVYPHNQLHTLTFTSYIPVTTTRRKHLNFHLNLAKKVNDQDYTANRYQLGRRQT